MFNIKNKKYEFKTFVTVFIATFLAQLFIFLFFQKNFFIPTGSVIFNFFTPFTVLTPIIGMLFGPFASLAIGASYFVLGVTTDCNSVGDLISIIIQSFNYFLLSYLGYKLWHSFFTKSISNRFELKDTYTIKKYIFIAAILSIISISVFLSSLFEIFYIFPDLELSNFALFSFPWFYCLFVFCGLMVYGLFVLLLVNYFNIPIYYPNKSKSDFKYPQLFNIIFLVGILLFVIIDILDYNSQLNYIQFLLLIIISIIYCFKPISSKKDFKFDKKPADLKYFLTIFDLVFIFSGLIIVIFNSLEFSISFQYGALTFLCMVLIFYIIRIALYLKKEGFRINIETKKYSLFEFILFVSLLIDILIVTCGDYLVSYKIFYDFGLGMDISSVLYDTILVLISFFITILVLSYLEKHYTIPLENISNNLSRYGRKDFSKDQFFKYKDFNSEIGILANSLFKAFTDMENYIKDIKNLNDEKLKVQTELNVAHKLQDSFLSKDFVVDDRVNLSALMIPAKSVGGDFYDFFMIDDDNLAFLIADVSDKGVPASLFMARSKQLIQSTVLTKFNDFSLDEIVTEVNKELCKNNESCMFITAWIGILNLENGKLTYVNAGHEYPLFKSNNNVNFLKYESNLVLGIMEDEVFTSFEMDLDPLSRILLFTDGVTDANNSNNEFFGEENLLKLFQSENLEVNESVKFIKESVDDFTENQNQFDDFTLLLLEYNPK